MMRPTKIALVAAVIGTGAVAQDRCPTAADITRGIRLDYADGTAEVYRPHGPGILRVDGMIGGALAYRMELAQGTHLLRYEDVEGGQTVSGSLSVYDYGVAPVDMPVPKPGGRWQAEVTVSSPDGDRPEAQSQVYDAADTIHIGSCTYDRVPVLIAYDTEDGYVEGLDYLPALGLGFLSWSQSSGDDKVSTEPTRISVAAK